MDDHNLNNESDLNFKNIESEFIVLVINQVLRESMLISIQSKHIKKLVRKQLTKRGIGSIIGKDERKV